MFYRTEEIKMISSKRFKQDCDSIVSLTQSQYNRDVFEWKNLFDDDHLVDFTIKTSGEDIQCHGTVLITKFPYFKEMFAVSRYSDNGRFASADLSFLHPASLRQVIEYAYTSEISCSENNIEELIKAASYLQADDVITECDAYLEKIVNKDNSLKFFIIGSAHNLRLITKKAHMLVLKHCQRIFKTDEFPKLHVEDLCALLHDDGLNVSSEEVVFDAILKWIQYDSESRQKATTKLLKAIRLDYLSEVFLSSLLEDEKYEHILTIKFLKCVNNILLQRSSRGHHKESQNLSPTTVQQPRFSYSKNKLFVIGGSHRNPYDGNTRDCMYWNRAEESWTKFTELPNYYTNCCHWSVCAGGGRIFVSGGYHTDSESVEQEGSAKVWMWHNNSWEALPPMIHGRYKHGFVYAAKKIFVFGGKLYYRDHLKCLNSNEFLDLESLEEGGSAECLLVNQNWQKTTRMKFCFHSPLISVLHDNIYLLGTSGRTKTFRGKTYCFNISKQTMTKMADSPSGFTGAVSTTVGNNIFVFGTKHRSMCMRYTPSTDTWCELSPSGPIEDKRLFKYLHKCDLISPLAIVDGKIILTKLIQRQPNEDTLIVDEYNVEENTWNKSTLAHPPSCFDRHMLSIVSAEISI